MLISASAFRGIRKPNAQTHLPPEAAATQERRLKAVRCSAVFGWGRSVGPPVECPAPRDTKTMGVLPDDPATPPCDALHTPIGSPHLLR